MRTDVYRCKISRNVDRYIISLAFCNRTYGNRNFLCAFSVCARVIIYIFKGIKSIFPSWIRSHIVPIVWEDIPSVKTSAYNNNILMNSRTRPHPNPLEIERIACACQWHYGIYKQTVARADNFYYHRTRGPKFEKICAERGAVELYSICGPIVARFCVNVHRRMRKYSGKENPMLCIAYLAKCMLFNCWRYTCLNEFRASVSIFIYFKMNVPLSIYKNIPLDNNIFGAQYIQYNISPFWKAWATGHREWYCVLLIFAKSFNSWWWFCADVMAQCVLIYVVTCALMVYRQ